MFYVFFPVAEPNSGCFFRKADYTVGSEVLFI